MKEKEIKRNFTTLELSDEQRGTINGLKGVGRTFALNINEYCPESREKSLALTKLEEAVMWATAAIARNGVAR